MSQEGYRTLVIACKDLNTEQYNAWAERYKDACASFHDRSGRVAAACDELETGLLLLGATAVEDKLQVCSAAVDHAVAGVLCCC
jgi:magnesium-transporting ATPase (P-type)